jgi:inner membrane protein
LGLIIIAAIFAYATHGLLDACTSYGTVLYWPFSDKRVSWDIIAIVDPVYSGILLIGVLLSLRFERRLPAIIALILSFCYLFFTAYWHQQALNLQQQLIHSRQQIAEQRRVMPAYLYYYRWRSIYFAEGKIYLDTINTSIIGSNKVISGISLTRFQAEDLPKNFNQAQRKTFAVFNWFTDGFLASFAQNPLTLVDARYLYQLTPAIALWGVEFNARNPRGLWISWIKNKLPDKKS